MSSLRKVLRLDHVRDDREKNVVRGHALFVRFMERKGLGDCVRHFPECMTLGNLRSATPHELLSKYDIRDAKDRERIMKIVTESHKEDPSDTESDFSSSPKQLGLLHAVGPLIREEHAQSSRALQRTVSEDGRPRIREKSSTNISGTTLSSLMNFGKHLSYSQFGLNASLNVGQQESSNLVRIRNSALGKSAPHLSPSLKDNGSLGPSAVSVLRRSSARSRHSLVLPGSPNMLLTLAPPSVSGAALGSPLDSPRSAQQHSQFQFVTNKSLIDSRRWSVASLASSSSGTNTPATCNLSSLCSSHEHLHKLPSTPETSAKVHSHFSSSESNPAPDERLGEGQGPGNGVRPRSSALRPRSRSLSSPAKSPGLDSGTMLMDNVYRERFPKAVAQMEERLSRFLECHQQAESFLLESDGAVRFVHRQVLELARDCLEKSKAKLISSSYFFELSESLELLLKKAKERSPSSTEHITQLIKQLLIIVSRPARLLECLEFDPEEFYRLLEVAEGHAKQTIKMDIPRYIISKLCLNRDPLVDLTDVSSIDSGRPETPDTDESSESQSQMAPLTEKQLMTRLLTLKKQPDQDDFETIKLISNGAYGAVYLVRHRASRQIFAMKKLLKSNLVLRNQVDQVYAERDILTFTDNPFVVSFFCSFETKKHLCLVLEYVEGGDCGTLLKNIGGPLSFDLARMYFAETLLALEYLHSFGIVHRDLKPDNLLITLMGHIKLTDFGLSKMGLMNLTTNLYEGSIDKDCTQFKDKQVFGTPEYIAPEVILRQGYGKPVDWWSMGIILYEFIIGCVPFFGNTPEELFSQVINEEVEWPDEEEYSPPDDAKDIIIRLLDHNPVDRLGTGGVHEVKEHIFFENLDWDSLLRQKAEFVPHLQSEEDTSYFDTRVDRYNHEEAEDTEEDAEDIMFNSFSSCSPRYSRVYQRFEELREENCADKQTIVGPSDEFNKSTMTPAVVGNQSMETGSNVQKLENIPVPHATEICTDSGKTHIGTDVTSNARNDDESFTTGQNIVSSKLAEDSKTKNGAVGHGNGISEISSKAVSKEPNPDVKHNDLSSRDLKKNQETKTVVIIKSSSRNSANVSANSVSSRATHIPNANRSNSYVENVDGTLVFTDNCHRSSDCDMKTSAKDFDVVDASTAAEKQNTSSILNIVKTGGHISTDAKCLNAPGDVQLRRQHLKHMSAVSEIPKFSISMEDGGSHDQHITDDKDKEEQDKLGPLRPLPPSKSAPTMPLVKEPDKVVLRSKGDVSKSVPKSVSASTLTLLMPPTCGEHVVCELPLVSSSHSPSSGASSPSSEIPEGKLLKPSIVMQRGPRGYGFTLRAIRVYYGYSEYYTIHHLVVAVEANSPAMEAGLNAGDLITHVNDTSVQGLLHIELVRLILSGGNRIAIQTVPLSSTSIRIGNRKALSRVDKMTRQGGKSHKAVEDRRRRSSLFKRLSDRKVEQLGSPMSPYRRSLGSVESQPNSPTQKGTCKPLNIVSNWSQASDSAHSTENSSSSSPGSSTPGSPANTMTSFSRPSSLHGLKHKLAINQSSCNRRKSLHNNPLSPLVKAPSPLAPSPSRSPSPLMLVHGHPAPGLHQPGISNMTQLYNPAQPQALIPSHSQARKTSHSLPSESLSPLLRRALSPERRLSSGVCRQMERNALSWDEQRHLAGNRDDAIIERSISSGSERLEEKIRTTTSGKKSTESDVNANANQISSVQWVSSYGPLMINKGREEERRTSDEEKFLKPLTVVTCSVESYNAAGVEHKDSQSVVDSGLVVVGGTSDTRRVPRGLCHGEIIRAADIQKPSTVKKSAGGLTTAEPKLLVACSGATSTGKNFQSFDSSSQEARVTETKEVKALGLAPIPVAITVRKHETSKEKPGGKTSFQKEKPGDRPV